MLLLLMIFSTMTKFSLQFCASIRTISKNRIYILCNYLAIKWLKAIWINCQDYPYKFNFKYFHTN